MRVWGACAGGLALLLSVGLSACGRVASGKEYVVRGQVLEVNRPDGTVTLRHDDIKGFMPAMTMPFKVKEARLLDGIARGDLVTATLFVSESDAYLTRLDRIGHAEVTGPVAVVSAARVLAPGADIPDATLHGSDGGSLRLSSLRGKAVAFTFIYTRCPLPNFCPLMDRQFAAAARRLAAVPALHGLVELLSISFDPEYDTPTVLAAHARAVGADGTVWRFVTADRPTLDVFAPQFGVVVSRDQTGLITHNLRTVIVSRDGRLVKIYSGTDWTVDELVADLTAAAGSAR